MPRRRKTAFEWLENKLRVLLPPNTNELAAVAKHVYYEINYWSLLKLIFVASYIYEVYGKIITRFFGENLFYIDLMCNSGINKLKIKETSKECDFVLGSPLIGAASNLPFRKMYFIDNKKENIDALKMRLEKLKEEPLFSKINALPICEDSNSAVDKIISEITGYENYHCLAFVDNQGMDVHWKTIEKLLNIRCDLIINYPTSEIKRARGQARVFKHQDLIDFFGDDVVKLGVDEDRLLDFYKTKLCSSDRVCEDIKIKGTKSFYYNLIVCCRRTRSGNPFLKRVQYEKSQIEKLTPELVKNALDQVKGRIKKLCDFNNQT